MTQKPVALSVEKMVGTAERAGAWQGQMLIIRGVEKLDQVLKRRHLRAAIVTDKRSGFIIITFACSHLHR